MDLFLDGRGPRYQQVARALRAAIAGGRLPHGTRLPPSRALADDLGVSRNTVVAAYAALRDEGLLSGKVGAGSYVQAIRPVAARPGLPHRPTPPQSAFARRARQAHDTAEFPYGLRKPGLRYAFQFGFPLVAGSLAGTWAREVARAAPYVRLDYPERQGLAALRRAVSEHVTRTRGVACTAEDVLIVDGAQQAFSLVADVLVDPGDTVVLEDPQYRAMRKVFLMHGASVRGIRVDAQGLDTGALPAGPAKLVAVTPSHQFPTGAVLSAARRRALLDYARRSEGWIMEDDYDGEFRYGRDAVVALQSMDRDGRVIYIGSFSKTLSPACRLGFLIMPPGLHEDFLAAKWAADLGCPPLEQIALARFIDSGGYARHLREVTLRLGERREAMVRALHEAFGHRCVFDATHAGMHVMVRLAGLDATDEDALVRLAEQRGVGLYPARPCYLQPHDGCELLMGFSTLPEREIHAAVRLVADCVAGLRADTGERLRRAGSR